MAIFHTHGSTSGDDSNSNTNHSDDNVRLRLKALTDGTCADCSSTPPSWASLLRTPTTAQAHTNVSTIAAFVCYHCAAHHRSLGTHICRVKSCTLDDWNDKEIWAADIGGNQRVNAIFEALPLNGDSKPTQHSTSADRADFIREKYVQQRYLDVANYKFCRARRTQSVVLEEDESIASDIFSAFMTPSPASSRSNRQSLRNIATPKNFKSSLFFTPPSNPATPVEKDEDDMFADSATTTSDLFGYGRSAPVKSRSSSFDGEVIEEGEEYGDSEEDDNASELPYPKMAQSVSNFSAFTLSSNAFPPKGSVDSRSVPSSPLQGVQAPMLHSPIVDKETLKRQKKEALDSEDYMRAAQINRQIAALLKPSSSPEIESLESLKKLAVRQEDYVRAAQLKARIEELRSQGRSNRQLQIESSMNSAMVSSRKKCEQGVMLGAFFGKDCRVDDDKMQKAIENEQVQTEEADDIEDESLMPQRKNSVLSKHFENQEDASERFSRSIMEASQHSRLDSMGFVMTKADVKKQEQTDAKPAPPKLAESHSSRRTLRSPIRDPTRDGGRRKKSKSRSRTRREKLRRSLPGNERNDEIPKLQRRDRRNKDDSNKQRRNRSASREKKDRNRSTSREKKSERNSQQRDRSKSKERSSGGNQRQNRDRSKSSDRKSHNKDKEDRGRSKSRDRKSHNRDKDSRERSKSSDRKSSHRKPRDRAKSNERRSDKDKQLHSRSKSRERKSSDRSGRTGRQSKVALESPSTRNRSKSRSRRDPRRKSASIRPAPGSREVQQSTSFSLPANGESFLSPLTAWKAKQFSTSMPACALPMFSPGSKGARDSSFRRKMLEVPDTGKEKPIHRATNLQDDTSVDDSFTAFASDNVLSAHQRNSAGRVSLSRRNMVADTYNHFYEVSPKGSHSMHLSRRGLSETFEHGLESQKGSFFAPRPPIASPSMSTISGVTKRSSATYPGFQTPSSKPYSKRQLIVGSPAGVEDFPSIATTPEAPKRKESMTEKYKLEVERTVARLERLREMKRQRGAALTKERRSVTA